MGSAARQVKNRLCVYCAEGQLTTAQGLKDHVTNCKSDLNVKERLAKIGMISLEDAVELASNDLAGV